MLVRLPNAASLQGSATDDGLKLPLSLSWTKVLGPSGESIVDPKARVTRVTFTQIGIYKFRLTAFDGEFSVSDDVTVRVEATGGSGRIEGKVTYMIDGRYGYAPNAEIVAIQNSAIVRRTWSGSDGAYVMDGMGVGRYTMRAYYRGYFGDFCCVEFTQGGNVWTAKGASILVNQVMPKNMDVPSDTAVPVTATLLPLRLMPDRSQVVTFHGEIGAEYEIQRSADLANWTGWTNVICVGATSEVVDADRASSQCRFYRMRLVE